MPIGFLIGLGAGLGLRAAVLFGGARLAAARHAAAAADAAALAAGRARLGLAAGGGRRRRRRAGRWRSSPALPFAVGYFLALGLPVGADRLSRLSEPPAPARPDAREWYPAGRLLAAMSLYGGALPVLVLPLIGGSYEVLRAPMGEFFRRLSHARARARPAAAQRPADRGARRVRRRRAAGRAGGLLARHLRAQSLSGRPHRARLGPARARLAGPAGAGLSAGLSRCSPRWRSPPPSRRASSASPAPASPARCCSPT